MLAQHPSQSTTHARIFFAMSHAEGCHRLALPAPEDAEVLPHVVSHLRQGRLGNGRLKVPQQNLGSIVTAKPRRPLPLDGGAGRSAQFRGKPWATGVPKLNLRGRHIQPGSCFVLTPCSRFPAPAGNPILVLGHGVRHPEGLGLSKGRDARLHQRMPLVPCDLAVRAPLPCQPVDLQKPACHFSGRRCATHARRGPGSKAAMLH